MQEKLSDLITQNRKEIRYSHLIIYCPVQKIINNKALNHVMLTSSIVTTCTVLNKTIRVPSQIVTWNNL